MKKFLYLLLVAAAGWTLYRTLKGAGTSLSKDAIRTKLGQGARVLDVRTHIEFGGGHYPGAINIPLDQLEGRLAELPDKNRPVVVYCHSGYRASYAVSILRRAGFMDVLNAGSLSGMPR